MLFDMNEIGRRVSRLRKKKGMTQMGLADALGVSFQAVSNWERGVTMPDISNLPALAETLDVSIDELLGSRRAAEVVDKVAPDRASYRDVKLAPEELTDLAPILPPDRAAKLLDGLHEGLTPEQVSVIRPAADLGETDGDDIDGLSDAELAIKAYEDDKFMFFVTLKYALPPEKLHELALRSYDENKGLIAGILADELSQEERRGFALRAFEEENAGYFDAYSGALSPEERRDLALRAYDEDRIAMLSLLADALDKQTRKRLRNKAYIEGKLGQFEVLS